MNTKELYTAIEVEKHENAEITITGELTTVASDTYRPQIVKNLQSTMELPGFRKGHVPQNMVVERIGEPAIMQEVAERALQVVYPEIVREHELDVVGQPQVTLTKLAPGNPIGFSIKSAVMPEVTLPDYKSIAENIVKEETNITVEDKEVDEVIEQIRTHHAQNKEGESAPPELTDEFVKTLGEFKDVADFKKKVKENLHTEKERKDKEQKRVAIGDQIIEQATIPLPRIFVESELDKMIGQFKADIERMGLEYETYLTQNNKTEADIRADWEKDAEKRAKLQLALNKIATTESITPDEATVAKETEHILSHVTGADPERVRVYVETMHTNEAVFQFLEGNTPQKKTK